MRSSARIALATRWVFASLVLIASCGGSSKDGTTNPVEQPTKGGITGKVIDTDSSSGGVAGATIQLSQAGTTLSPTTGATGDFAVGSLDPGAWTIQLVTPANRLLTGGETGSRTANVTAGGTVTITTFTIGRPKGSLTGSVKNGTTGVLSSLSLLRSGFTTRSVSTDASGTFTASQVPVGAWTLALAVPQGTQLAVNESGTRAVTVTADQSTQVSAFALQTQAAQLVTEIHIAGVSFIPSNAIVAAGTSVMFINDETAGHTITPQNATQIGGFQRVEFGAKGVVLQHTFSTAGQVYRYRCEPHSADFQTGMVGTITVQ